MTIIGTTHFVNIAYAVNYYRKQGYSLEDVHNKLICKEIQIGQPVAKEGETIFLNVEEGRYFIDTK